MDTHFDEIYHLYSKDVFRLAYSYTINKSDSEDIVQKVFYKLYKNKKILSLSNEEIKKWLLKVCVNEAKDYLKSPIKRIFTNMSDNIIDISISSSPNGLINALNSIPTIYRLPLYLYYYEGYSIKEISSIIKKSESAIKMRLSRGKELLKNEMEGK